VDNIQCVIFTIRTYISKFGQKIKKNDFLELCREHNINPNTTMHYVSIKKGYITTKIPLWIENINY